MKRFFVCSLLLAAASLSACSDGGMRESLGLTRDAPDEFTVVSRPPLTVPPEFNLRPPHAGDPVSREATADAQARSLLTGGKTKPLAGMDSLTQPTVETAVTPVIAEDVGTTGSSSLLKRAGAANADDSIRDKLTGDRNMPVANPNAPTLYDQITGQDKAEPVVDAAKEAQRIRDAKAAGTPIDAGAVPEEQTKPKSVIDRIF